MKTTTARVLVRPASGMEFLPAYNEAIEDDSGLATTESIVRDYLLAAPIRNIPPATGRALEIRRELNLPDAPDVPEDVAMRRCLQPHIDGLLQQVIDGKQPRTIFRLDASSTPDLNVRDQAMTMEILVLIHVEGMKAGKAKKKVTDAFSNAGKKMEDRTVQYAYRRWSKHPAFSIEQVLAYAEATKAQRHSA